MRRGILTTIGVFVIGILIVVAGFFLLDIEKVTLNFWAFGSLLFSLAVSLLLMITLVAPKRNKNGVFYVAGLNSAILIYEAMIVISILLIKSFTDRLGGFIFTQIAINALFFIVVIIITTFSGRIHDSNARTAENIQNEEYNKPKRGGF